MILMKSIFSISKTRKSSGKREQKVRLEIKHFWIRRSFEQFSTELDLGNNANYLRELFKKSYLEHENLADATRYLANELFKMKV